MNQIYFKSRLLILFFLVISYAGYSQKTISGSFKIISNTHPENEAFFIASIEKANMEQYRLKDENVNLTFTNGFVLELFSAKSVFIKQGQIDPTSYKTSTLENYDLPVFFIQPDGWITTTGYNNSFKKTKAK
jgi:hypothetical protein